MWPKYRHGDVCWMGSVKVHVVQFYWRTLGKSEVTYIVRDFYDDKNQYNAKEHQLEPSDRGQEDGA